MIESMAFCFECERIFKVDVSKEDFKKGVCYTKCKCGKSGQFNLIGSPTEKTKD